MIKYSMTIFYKKFSYRIYKRNTVIDYRGIGGIKLKRLGLVALLVVLTLIVTSTIVQADPWSAIVSGYAVTTNHHGEEVLIPPVPPLRARVGVLAENLYDPSSEAGVYEVRVDLRDPDGNVVDSDTVSWTQFSDATYKGKPIKGAWTGDLVPGVWVVGHYSVKAYFFDKYGKELAQMDDLTAMRATTVMVVPEVPIGTLTILLTMLASLAIFARKRF